MQGNRKHGYMRSNRGGFKPQPWHCSGCNASHAPTVDRTQALDGLDYCERTYWPRREQLQRDRQPQGEAVRLFEPAPTQIEGQMTF